MAIYRGSTCGDDHDPSTAKRSISPSRPVLCPPLDAGPCPDRTDLCLARVHRAFTLPQRSVATGLVQLTVVRGLRVEPASTGRRVETPPCHPPVWRRLPVQVTTHGQRTRPWVSTGAGRGGVGQLPAGPVVLMVPGPERRRRNSRSTDPAQQVIAATCSSQAVKGGDEGTSTSTLMKGGGSTFAA